MSLGEPPVKPESSRRPDEEHQVLQFRPRKIGPASRQGQPRQMSGASKVSQVEGLATYETEQDGDNYRHRMLVNLAALLLTIALAVAGAWLAWQLAEMRRNQDCALSGRSNCMRIETTSPHRP